MAIARMVPETVDLPDVLPTETAEDLLAEGIEEDPILQVVTHIAASRYGHVVMREIIDPLMAEMYKLAETAGPIGQEISRRLGVVDDVTVTLAYNVVPDVVTIIASGFDSGSMALSIEEMIQAPLRKAGWARADLEALIQRRFAGGYESRIQAALPGFTIDKLTLRDRCPDASCITTQEQAIEWVDAYIVARLERTLYRADERLGREVESYRDDHGTLPLKFEAIVETMLSDLRAAEEQGLDLESTYEGIGGSREISDEVARIATSGSTLRTLANAMRLHEQGDDVAAVELVRSKISPTRPT